MSSSQLELGSVHHIPHIEVLVETDDEVRLQEASRIQELCMNNGPNSGVLMYFGEEGIELRKSTEPHHKGFKVDYSTIDQRTGAGNLSKHQPFAKAMGRGATIFDATAGFASDAARLALMGFQVVAVERSPIVAAMVRDGLRRANDIPTLKETLCLQLTFHEAESSSSLLTFPATDVVYLDPMFPPKRKKSALPPGPIQFLKTLVGFDSIHETQALFQIARTRARQRVVVKRPNHAQFFDEDPQAVYKGKLVRYEAYFPQ